MNEQIKQWAEQAGITFDPLGAAYTYGSLPDFLERFAELVRQDEREACAKFAEERYCKLTPKEVAQAIRRRTE